VSAAQSVASFLKQDIVSGNLPAGTRIFAEDLAEQLGVSRIPVREALIGMDREGWLRTEPNRGGIFVCGFRRDDVLDHYELRGAVFGLVARRAAGSSSQELATLQEFYRALRRTSDSDTFSAVNDHLLRSLNSIGASARLRAALRITPSMVGDNFFAVVGDAREIQQSGLATVLKAIADHDGDTAFDQMRELHRRQGNAVVATFSTRGLLSPPAEPPARSSGPSPADSESRTGADRVSRYIRGLIIRGTLASGQRVPQDEVALAVGVSRIPVREALIGLEREGWLRIQPNRGAYVNPLDRKAIEDHYDLYGCYWGFAARRAIERSSDTELAGMGPLAEKLAALKSPDAVERANRAYLDQLVELARSPRLEVSLRSTVPIVSGNFFALSPQTIAPQQRYITRVQRAIARHDIAAAEELFALLQRRQAAIVTARQRSTSRADRISAHTNAP
jgi:DNA-binding GntR family transcriptional regulator